MDRLVGPLVDFISGLPLQDDWPLVLGIVVVALLLLAWIAGASRIQRLGRMIQVVLEQSIPGSVSQQDRRGAGFTLDIQPPPEPFTRFTVIYRPPSLLTPIGALAALFRSAGHLIVQTELAHSPGSELVWIQGGVPGQVLGNNANAAAWIHRRLATIHSEYATRGTDIGPLMQTFSEFQARFAPMLYRISIQADEDPMLEVVVKARGLTPENIPPLIATIQTLGRSALHG